MSRRAWKYRGDWCSLCGYSLAFDVSGARIPINRDGRWILRCTACGGRTDDPDCTTRASRQAFALKLIDEASP